MTAAGTAPTTQDLVATQGADFSIIFSFTQAAGGLTGTTATMSVLTTSGAAATVSSFTGSLNVTSDTTATFTASLTSTQIATLVATGSTTFKYALNATNASLVTPWLAGALTFLQPGVGATTASGSFTITAGANTITGTLTVAANAAVNVSFTPTGTIAATDVQTAIAEVASEAVQTSALTTNGNLLTRAAGVPSEITRANLAADSAFTSSFTLLTRTNGQNQLPDGVIAQTIPRFMARDVGTTSLALGQQQFHLIWLPAGTVNAITFISGTTAAVAPTHQWFSIYDSNRNKLAVTNDDTNTAWPASTAKTLTISGGYTVPTEGYYYLGVLFTGTTAPSFTASTSQTQTTSIAPATVGRDNTNTGLTTPASAPATAAAFAAQVLLAYAYVS